MGLIDCPVNVSKVGVVFKSSVQMAGKSMSQIQINFSISESIHVMRPQPAVLLSLSVLSPTF